MTKKRVRTLIAVIPVALLAVILGASVAIGVDESAPVDDTLGTVALVIAAPDAEVQDLHVALSIDGWPEPGREVPRVAEGLYAATFAFQPGVTIEGKIQRRGTWASVEKAADGGEVSNLTFTTPGAGQHLTLFRHVTRWADHAPARDARSNLGQFAPGTAGTRTRTLTGDIRVHEAFESQLLGNARRIQVLVPAGYDSSAQRYPVLYLHDGQNVFDRATSFTQVEWGVDEAVRDLRRQGKIPATIVVAIDNNRQRLEEYTPYVDARRGGGSGDTYLRFITEELKPFIDRTYRTLPEREHTAIAGASLGGLISMHAAIEFSTHFSRFGVVSPSVQWNDFHVVERAGAAEFPPDTRIWIEVGRLDGLPGDPKLSDPPSEYLLGARRLAESLRAKGIPSAQLHYREHPERYHHERGWARETPAMLEFLLAD